MKAWSGVDFLETIQGTTGQYPAIRVMFLAHRLKGSGVLSIRGQNRYADIDMQNGVVCGCIGIPGLLQSINVQGAPGDEMYLLLNRAIGSGTPPDQALRAAADGIGDYLVSIIPVQDAKINYKLDATMIRTPMSLPVSIPQMIAGALQRSRPGHVIRSELQPRINWTVHVTLPEDSREEQWGLNAVAMRLLRESEGRPSLRSLTRAGRSGVSNNIWQAIDLLIQLGLIELIEARRQRKGRRDRVAQAGAGAGAGEPRKVDPRAELEQALRALKAMKSWEVLEIKKAEQLDDEGLNQALREVSSRYHPDLYSGHAQAVRDIARSCFEQVMTAFNELRDPAVNGELRARLEAEARGEQYVSPESRKQAELAYSRGKIAYRKKDWDAALSAFSVSLNLDPKPWRYTYMREMSAYYAKQKPGTTVAYTLIKLMSAIKPQKEDPRLDRERAEVLFDSAELLINEQSEYRTAIRLYNQVLKLNPEHHGAHRRLRLHKIRVAAARNNQEKDSPGLLDSLKNLFSSNK
ncbi:MAG: J domain-containing protein [Myxococcota bacterium]